MESVTNLVCRIDRFFVTLVELKRCEMPMLLLFIFLGGKGFTAFMESVPGIRRHIHLQPVGYPSPTPVVLVGVLGLLVVVPHAPPGRRQPEMTLRTSSFSGHVSDGNLHFNHKNIHVYCLLCNHKYFK